MTLHSLWHGIQHSPALCNVLIHSTNLPSNQAQYVDMLKHEVRWTSTKERKLLFIIYFYNITVFTISWMHPSVETFRNSCPFNLSHFRKMNNFQLDYCSLCEGQLAIGPTLRFYNQYTSNFILFWVVSLPVGMLAWPWGLAPTWHVIAKLGLDSRSRFKVYNQFSLIERGLELKFCVKLWEIGYN